MSTNNALSMMINITFKINTNSNPFGKWNNEFQNIMVILVGKEKL